MFVRQLPAQKYTSYEIKEQERHFLKGQSLINLMLNITIREDKMLHLSVKTRPVVTTKAHTLSDLLVKSRHFPNQISIL